MSRHKTAHRAPAAAPPPVQGQNRRERSGSLSRRLQLVTALLLTAEEFPGELGESFGAACAAVGVEPATSGYGLVLAQDEAGGRLRRSPRGGSGVRRRHSPLRIWAVSARAPTPINEGPDPAGA